MSNQKLMVTIAALTSCFSAAALGAPQTLRAQQALTPAMTKKIEAATIALQPLTRNLIQKCSTVEPMMRPFSSKQGVPVSDNEMHSLDYFLQRTPVVPKNLSPQETARVAKIVSIARAVNDCGKAMQDVGKAFAGANPRTALEAVTKDVDLEAAESLSQRSQNLLIKFFEAQTNFLAAFDSTTGLQDQINGDANLKKLFANIYADAVMK